MHLNQELRHTFENFVKRQSETVGSTIVMILVRIQLFRVYYFCFMSRNVTNVMRWVRLVWIEFHPTEFGIFRGKQIKF